MNSTLALDKAVQQFRAGNLSEAERLCREILQTQPRDADAQHLLGEIACQLGRYDLAVERMRSALQERPEFAEAHCDLGVALQALGKLQDAEVSYRQALRFKPDLAAAHNNLGNVLKDQGKLEDAIDCFRQALRLEPNYAEAHNDLGVVWLHLGELSEARTNFERALHLKPDFAAARCNLGLVLQELGDFAGAEEAFRAVLVLDPRHAVALSQLATLLRSKLPAADRASLERRLADSDLGDVDRYKLLFGLAQVCDALGEYEQAAAQACQANALQLDVCRRHGVTYDVDVNARFVDMVIAAFTPAFFERVRGFGLETQRPVFIFGLPRSGTTLTEQILAAHSRVFCAGELHLANDDFLTLEPEPTKQSAFTAVVEVQGDFIRRLAQQHLDQLRLLNDTAERVVDKMPENYLHLGLLASLFPRAKFIHCRRDLRDVAVSCWITHFRDLVWTNDTAYIAARFAQYRRLMEHWRTVLPAAVLEVNYEETVADLPRAARRLVEWCGLDWEPACLAFHEVARPVRTASFMQVRQPVHRRSVERWRNYERELSELFAALTPLLDSKSERKQAWGRPEQRMV